MWGLDMLDTVLIAAAIAAALWLFAVVKLLCILRREALRDRERERRFIARLDARLGREPRK